jgi:hypothetical protein
MAATAFAKAPGPLAMQPLAAEDCSSGPHTLSHLGDHVYPEMGNGGYQSVHTDVNLVYDANQNSFLAGTNVELTQLSTQCLTDFSLDFAPHTPDNEEGPGADMEVQKVFVNGEQVEFEFVQPTYPGDPNGQNDPDPAAHQTGLDTPVSATNPLPPACTPDEEVNGAQCPARKLVIKPTAPIPGGETFTVRVEYTGHPGVYTDGGGEADGWFRSNEPAGDGAFVTTEPVGTEAWMPLNNHPSAKPTYDFNEKVTLGRTVIANGELVSHGDNEADAQFPEGSTTWVWHSPEPIANYLVENSIGNYDMSEHEGANGVTFYEFQGGSLSAEQKAKNKEVMDQQEDITAFQERFNGPFPFTTDGIVVGVPKASFEEEMQGKITFNRGKISIGTFNHENMHQWWGDNVSESNFNETFFKEGMAKLGEFLREARVAAIAAGGLDTPAGEAAFDASLVAQFHTNYLVNGTMWTRAPSNPNPVTLFSQPTTYTRPATAYIALRQILGKGNWTAAMKNIQQDFGGSSIHESQLENEFAAVMPNQSPACRSRLNQFFTEWFDTEFPGAGSPTARRPQLTGPGLDVSASGTTFYNADGTCKHVTPAPPTTTVSFNPTPDVDGKIVGPATISLTAIDQSSGIASTEFKLDNANNFSQYGGPITVSALGVHTLQFRSTNRDGAVETTKQLTFTVIQHDAPVTSANVSPTPDLNGKVVGPARVTLSATENGGGVAKTEFSVDGGGFEEYTAPFTVSGFAAHTVEYRSTNRDGAVETTKQLTFTVIQHDAPTTTAKVLPEPVDGKVTGPATVVLSATDPGVDVSATEFKLDGGDFQPYEGPIAVSAFGDHTIEYRSTNADGAVEETQQVAFTVVPHAAPTTAARLLPNPAADGRVTGSATVVLAAKDNGGGVASTEFKLDGGAFQPYEGPIAVATLGGHKVEYRSTNRDGIAEATQQLAFTIVAPPQPPKPPAAKPVCAEPHLSVAVSHPLRRGKGAVALRRGKAYRYTGSLTCGPSRTPAPEGTVIGVASVAGGTATRLPGITLGPGGSINTLMQFSGRRTLAFGFAADGFSAEARIRVAVVVH